MQQIDVSFLPAIGNLLTPNPNTISVVIAIDVLRATTTMTTAMEYGANEIFPVDSIESAMSLYDKFDPNSTLLGGERNNIKPLKFHFGNSPFEYQNKEVSNKKVIFTTTNGTKLLHTLKEFNRIYIGCFRNVTPLVEYISKNYKSKGSILLACAGSNDKFSFDDVLCAGAFVDTFQKFNPTNIQLTDTAKVAKMLYNETEDSIIDFVKTTSHGKSLLNSGFEQDIDYCFTKDSTKTIAVYENRIVKLMQSNL
jgi:2-phosphosulfolactate phosphatase